MDEKLFQQKRQEIRSNINRDAQLRKIDNEYKDAVSKNNSEFRKEVFGEGVKRLGNLGKYVGSSFGKGLLNLVKAEAPDPITKAIATKGTDKLSEWENQAATDSPQILQTLKLPKKDELIETAGNQIVPVPGDNPVKTGVKSFLKKGIELGEGFTSPAMLSQLLLTTAPGMSAANATAQAAKAGAPLTLSALQKVGAATGKVLSSSFLPSLAEGTLEGGKKTIEGIKEGNPEKIGSGAAEAIGSGTFAYGLGKSLLSGKPAPMKNAEPPVPAEAPLQLGPGKVGRISPTEYVPPKGSQKFYSEVKFEPFEKKSIIQEKPIEQNKIKQTNNPYKLYSKTNIGEPFNLTKGQIEHLNLLENEIKSSKAGRRIFIESDRGEGNARKVISDPSTFPIENLASKETQLKIIDKAKSGVPLTGYESGIFSQMLDYINNKRGEVVSLKRSIPVSERTAENFNFGNNAKKIIKEPLGEIKNEQTGFSSLVKNKKIIKSQYPDSFSAKPIEQLAKVEKPSIVDTKIVPRETIVENSLNPIEQKSLLKKVAVESKPLTENKTFTTEDIQKVEIPKDEAGAVDLSKPEVPVDAKKLAYEIAEKENQARSVVKKDKFRDAKTKIITEINDELYPVSEMLKRAEKTTDLGKTAKPSEKFYAQSGNVYRSRSIADQTLKDTGLLNAIQAAPDAVILDQVLKAKHGADLVKNGFETGRDVLADQKIIETFGEQYKPFTDAIVGHSQKMLDYAVDSGLISPDFAKELKTKYPNYVPFNRIIESIEGSEAPPIEFKKAKGSLAKQTFIKKMKGSDLPVENSIQNIIKKTYETYQQGEINKTGQTLVKAQEVLPELKDVYWEVKPDAKVKNYFDVLDNGVKRRFETNSPELMKSLKGLNSKELNTILKVFNAFNRVFKVGTTGLKMSFLVRNPIKDLQSAGVNLPYGAQVAKSFIKSLYDVAGKTKEFDNALRKGVFSSEFDVLRDQPKSTVESIRSKASSLKRTRYLMKNPGELLSAIEQKIAVPEYATRLSVFKEGKKHYMKKGFSEADATIKATVDAQKATADFSRRGTFGREIGAIFPYLRAGFAGIRTKIHYAKESPAGFGLRLAATSLLPTALLTIYNLSDEKRAKAYWDIKRYEKENNFLLIPDDTKKSEESRWDAYKMPSSPEFKGEQRIVQQMIETLYAKHPADFKELAQNVFGIFSPLTSVRDAISSTTPVFKVPFEQLVNKDVYRDKAIVPEGMLRRPVKDQDFPWTPQVFKKLGQATGVSPLKLQHAAYGFGGAVGGNDIPNILDNILSYTGAIKPEQVGGKSILQTIKDSFKGAAGGQKIEDAKRKMKGK